MVFTKCEILEQGISQQTRLKNPDWSELKIGRSFISVMEAFDRIKFNKYLQSQIPRQILQIQKTKTNKHIWCHMIAIIFSLMWTLETYYGCICGYGEILWPKNSSLNILTEKICCHKISNLSFVTSWWRICCHNITET